MTEDCGEMPQGLSILFIHQNFPAQFGRLGAYLAEQGWDVVFATARQDATPPKGTRMMRFGASREPSQAIHPHLRGTEAAVLNGLGFARAASKTFASGYQPSVIVTHSGWGPGTFARAVWPEVPLVAYAEWFYRYPPSDRVGSPPENEVEERARLLVRNVPMLLDTMQSQEIICPTHFQASQFPKELRSRMTVIHDGIDCTVNAPDPNARRRISQMGVPDDAEVITFATRSLEPHRGFPEFMRALAKVQKSRPRLHAVIAGKDYVAYGRKLPEGESWKQRMLAELDLDTDRIHFTGILPHRDFRALLQGTGLHVYFTVPFVLGWSLIEAMACGAPILASDVAPVREVLQNGRSAMLVDHRDVDAVANAMEAALDDRSALVSLGATARRVALERYDSRWIFPAKAGLFRDVALHLTRGQECS